MVAYALYVEPNTQAPEQYGTPSAKPKTHSYNLAQSGSNGYIIEG